MATFEPVRKSAIAEEISARLLSLIQEKQLKPGDKLPPERELAATMQVSRPSLREALRALSMMNVLEIRQGDGAYVTSLEPALLVEHLDFVISLDDSTIHHLFEVRRILEAGIAGLAAQRATEQQLADLDALFHQSLDCRDDAVAFLQVDLAMHELMAEATGNPLLRRVMASMSRLGLASRSRTGANKSVRDRTVIDHRAIVAAIQARDPDAAVQAMLDHLNHVEQSLDVA